VEENGRDPQNKKKKKVFCRWMSESGCKKDGLHFYGSPLWLHAIKWADWTDETSDD